MHGLLLPLPGSVVEDPRDNLSPLWESGEGEGPFPIGQAVRTLFGAAGAFLCKGLGCCGFSSFLEFFFYLFFFFVRNFEVGSGPPGEHGLSRGGSRTQKPRWPLLTRSHTGTHRRAHARGQSVWTPTRAEQDRGGSRHLDRWGLRWARGPLGLRVPGLREPPREGEG